MLTADRLRELLRYDADTGLFVWLVCTSNRARIGSVAGRSRHDGYRIIGVDGRYYLAHRLAWLYVRGSWPPDHLDHIDGDPSNNRIANLREASPLQNRANARIRRDSGSGFKGVRKEWNRWSARITIDRKEIHLGAFATPEEAYAAYCRAAEKARGRFARF